MYNALTFVCKEGWQHGVQAQAVSCLKDAVSLNKHASLEIWWSYSEDLMLLCIERTNCLANCLWELGFLRVQVVTIIQVCRSQVQVIFLKYLTNTFY